MSKNELALETSNKIANIHDYTDSKIPERRWKVEYVGGKCFYLTNEERIHFLQQIKNGATIIQIGLLTLTSRFSYIVPIRNEQKKKNYDIVNGVAVEI